MYSVLKIFHYKFVSCHTYFVKIKYRITWKLIISNKPIYLYKDAELVLKLVI